MDNQPRNHDVGFYGPTGVFIKISYSGNLVISGYTGCRLPRDTK
nr:LppA family lipoprotein [Mycobacterium lepraemurium]